MILFAVLVGLYLIGFIGYYKMTARTADSVENTRFIRAARPLASLLIIGTIAAVWPLMVMWSLVGEASK